MAAFTGSGGSVTIEAGGGAEVVLLHISGWTMDWSRDVLDVTDFDSTTGWNETQVGLAKITGTLEGFYQDKDDDALVISEVLNPVELVLLADANRKFTFADNGSIITGMSFETEVGAPNRWTATFSANVAPTVA